MCIKFKNIVPRKVRVLDDIVITNIVYLSLNMNLKVTEDEA